MYVGCHDANNVSNFGGDPVTQLNLKTLKFFNYAVLQARRTIAMTSMVHHSRDAVTGFAAVATRRAQAAGVWKTNAGIKWP